MEASKSNSFKILKKTFLCILVSIFLVRSFLPFLYYLIFKQAKLIAFIKDNDNLIGISAFTLFLLIISYKRLTIFLMRYKDTLKLKNPPWLFINSILLILIFTCGSIAFNKRLEVCDVLQQSKYLAFSLFNFIAITIWLLMALFYKEKREDESQHIESNGIRSDEPCQSISQDSLNRNKFVEDLFDEINNIPLNYSSFVLVLDGSWGDGKTSVLNFLRNKFVGTNDFIVVNFEPLYYEENIIVKAFYGEIEKNINKKYILPNLKREIRKYQNIINTGFSKTGFELNLFIEDEKLEEVKERIESYILKTEKKILIIIDDIDRLQPQEILMIFKLVRLSANFKNTIFLLSFDLEIIKKYFKEQLKYDEKYLEKFVQEIIPLPAIEQEAIDHFLDKYIDDILRQLNINEQELQEFYKDFSYIYQSKIKQFFKNLRQVKRYLNGIRVTLSSIKTEINLEDFFILEIFRLFYPKIYNDIRKYPYYYIPLKWKNKIELEDPFFALDDKIKYSKIKEHIDAIISDLDDKDTLFELLKSMFSVEIEKAYANNTRITPDEARRKRRITHPDCFYKYFMLQVPSSQISDESFKIFTESWREAQNDLRESIIEKTFEEIKNKNKLLLFIKMLMDFRKEFSNDTCLSLINFIYKNSKLFSKEGRENLFFSEYDQVFILFIRIINDNINKGEIDSVLKNIINKSNDLGFVVRIVEFCNRKKGGDLYNIYDSVNLEEIQNITANRLKEHFVSGEKNVFELYKDDWHFILFQWSTNWESYSGDNHSTVNNYIFSLIDKNSHLFFEFLNYLKEINRNLAKISFDIPTISKLYDVLKLRRLAELFQDDISLSKDKSDVIKIFLKDINEKVLQ